jgi:hypothetical protein
MRLASSTYYSAQGLSTGNIGRIVSNGQDAGASLDASFNQVCCMVDLIGRCKYSITSPSTSASLIRVLGFAHNPLIVPPLSHDISVIMTETCHYNM